MRVTRQAIDVYDPAEAVPPYLKVRGERDVLKKPGGGCSSVDAAHASVRRNQTAAT